MNKSRQRMAFVGFGSARNGERGLTLIEILVALGILAATATVFLLGMSTSSKAVMVSQERVAVDSLAKSQMERIKSVEYDDVTDPPDYEAAKLTNIPTGYDIAISAQRWDPLTDTVSTDDTSLQKITVTVTHDGEPAFILEGYKLKP